GSLAQGAGGIDDVVDQNAALALDVADDVHDLGFVGPRPALVDDGQFRIVESLGQGACTHHAADIERNHEQIVYLLAPDIAQQYRRGVDVVDQNIENTLDLVGMQLNRDGTI